MYPPLPNPSVQPSALQFGPEDLVRVSSFSAIFRVNSVVFSPRFFLMLSIPRCTAPRLLQ